MKTTKYFAGIDAGTTGTTVMLEPLTKNIHVLILIQDG